jgi:hypothetical protein
MGKERKQRKGLLGTYHLGLPAMRPRQFHPYRGKQSLRLTDDAIAILLPENAREEWYRVLPEVCGWDSMTIRATKFLADYPETQIDAIRIDHRICDGGYCVWRVSFA